MVLNTEWTPVAPFLKTLNNKFKVKTVSTGKKNGYARQEDHLNLWNCCSMNEIPISNKKMLIFNTQWTPVAPFFENFE